LIEEVIPGPGTPRFALAAPLAADLLALVVSVA
jgi:hypothetical protein